MDARHPILTRLLMVLAGGLMAAVLTACGGYGGSNYGGGGGGGMCGGGYGQVACPTVSVTAPAANANVSGAAVPLTATAAAAPGYTIASVQFFVDGTTSVGTVMAAPYTVNWDSTKVANGNHSITAKATDNIGGSMTSAAVMVNVMNGAVAMSASQIFPMPSSKASGVARVSVESATGAVSGTVTLSGMSARTVTINQGFAGSTGEAVVTLAPREGSSGEFVVPANVNLSAEQAGAFAQGRLYVIATSAAHPNGEIRGQLAPDGVHVTFSELGASPEAAALGLRASGVAAATVDAHAGTLTVHVNTAGVEDATGARVVSGAGTALADLARSPVEMGHFSTELVRISASDVESFEAGRLSVSVAASSAPAGALRGAIGPDAVAAGN
ncbi:MAG TPA: CHRD domain-containing protein [Steroidobacteraceae bacterium]|nr:CHRD domain-containing protein [Steroidobacteraceae bacterium]